MIIQKLNKSFKLYPQFKYRVKSLSYYTNMEYQNWMREHFGQSASSYLDYQDSDWTHDTRKIRKRHTPKEYYIYFKTEKMLNWFSLRWGDA